MTSKTPPTAYQIRQSSMEITAADGSPASPDVLYQALHDDDAEVRVSAALALAKLGDLSPAVIDPLFDAADWRREPEAGDIARYGIVELGKTNGAIVERLVAALTHNRRGLSGVAECLGNIGQATPAVIDGLLAFIQQDRDADPYSVVSAINSLLRLGYTDDSLVDRLLTLYQRGDSIVRSVALCALAWVKQPPAAVIDLLLVALQEGQHEASAAASSLARIGVDQPQVVAALVQASRAKDWRVRGESVAALSGVPTPTPAVIDVLYEALGDPDWFVRVQAMEGLSNLRSAPPAVRDRLLTMLTSEQNASERGTIAITLASLGHVDDDITAVFLDELRSQDASVRERIVRNWWLLGSNDPLLLAPLQAALQDEDSMVRASAAASLKQLGR